MIRDWTEDHFDFAGYVTGFDPSELADRTRCGRSSATARREGVHRHGRRLGGRRAPAAPVIAAHPAAKRGFPDLRMIVVAGPRIDPDSLPVPRGLEVRPYVPTCTGTWPPATSRWCRAG